MTTDPPPRSARARREFDRSDALTQLDVLPDARELQERAAAFEKSLAAGETRAVRAAGDAIVELLARTYALSKPTLRVLGMRPRHIREGGQSELFGDYDFEDKRIRIWMRTA